MIGIVSGLERSGTALMMQILEAGGVSIAFDGSRPADYHNPKGYYELAGGKIIRRLMEGKYDLSKYDGMFIKITAFGLNYLPEGSYGIIYMVRDIEEVLSSIEKMDDSLNKDKIRPLLEKLNAFTIDLINRRSDIAYCIINYKDLLTNPKTEVVKVANFVGRGFNVGAAVRVIDPNLYRNRVKESEGAGIANG